MANEEDSTKSQSKSTEGQPTATSTPETDSVATQLSEIHRSVETQTPKQASPESPKPPEETTLQIETTTQSLREELDSVQTANLEVQTQAITKRQDASFDAPNTNTQTAPDSTLQDKPSTDQDPSTKSTEDDKDKEKGIDKESSSPEPEKAKGILGVLQGPYGKLAIAAVAMLIGGPVVAAATYFALTQAEKMTKKSEGKIAEQSQKPKNTLFTPRNAYLAATATTLAFAPPIGIAMAAAGGVYMGGKAAAKGAVIAGSSIASVSAAAYSRTKDAVSNLFSKKEKDIDSVEGTQNIPEPQTSVDSTTRNSQEAIDSTDLPASEVTNPKADLKPDAKKKGEHMSADYSNEEALSGAAEMFKKAKREVSEAISTKPDYSNEEALSGAASMFEGTKKEAEKTPTIESPSASVREGETTVLQNSAVEASPSSTAQGVDSRMEVGMQTRTDGQGTIREQVGDEKEKPTESKESRPKRDRDQTETIDTPPNKKSRFSEKAKSMVDGFREKTPVSSIPPGNNLSPSAFKTASLDRGRSQDNFGMGGL
jgi:hypothetical protein